MAQDVFRPEASFFCRRHAAICSHANCSVDDLRTAQKTGFVERNVAGQLQAASLYGVDDFEPGSWPEREALSALCRSGFTW